MKRIIKLFLNLVLASIAVGLTLLVIFLITPSWQKLFVEKALSRDTARRWQVGSVSIQPAGVELEDVYVLDGPVGARTSWNRENGIRIKEKKNNKRNTTKVWRITKKMRDQRRRVEKR